MIAAAAVLAGGDAPPAAPPDAAAAPWIIPSDGIAFVLLTLGLVAALGLLMLWRRAGPRAPWRAQARALLDARGWTPADAVQLGLLLLILQAAGLAGWEWLRRTRPGIEETPAFPGFAIAQYLLFQAPAALFIVLRARQRGANWIRAFDRPGRDMMTRLGLGAAGYLALLPPMAALLQGAGWLLPRLGLDATPQPVLHVIAGAPVWARAALIVLAVAAAPAVEELIFRGVVFPALTPRLGARSAAAASAILFAALHLNALAFAPLVFMGLSLCAAYAYSGSLVVPIVMHMLFNSINLVLLMAGRV